MANATPSSWAQVEHYQDCSGKSTYYRYDERQHLVAVTDALNQTTTLERKPDGEALRISHPDGTSATFTYNPYGQVLGPKSSHRGYERMFGKEPDLSRFNADHPVDLIVVGLLLNALQMLNETINKSVGSSLKGAGRRAGIKPGDMISEIIWE